MKDTTKDIIIQSLLELMNSQYLKDIYVKDIAKKAKITRQTFYRHFKDKYDVINWYYDREIESLFIATLSINGIHKNLATKCSLYKSHMHFFKNAYYCKAQNSLTDHEFRRIYESISKKIYQNKGIEKNLQSKKLQYAINFFCHGVIHMTVDWLNQDCPEDCETFADILIDLMPNQIKDNLKLID